MLITRTLFCVLRDHWCQPYKNKCRLIQEEIARLTNISSDDATDAAANFVKVVQYKWKCMGQKTFRVFEARHAAWLASQFEITTITPSQKRPGRPLKEFSCLTRDAKRKRVGELASKDTNQVMFAAGMTLRSAGNTAAAKLIEEVGKSPTRASKVLAAWDSAKSGQQTVIPFTAEEALAQTIEMTKAQYNSFRSSLNSKKANVLPPYYKILEERKKCYPDGIQVSESVVVIPLQSMVNHTTFRLLISQEPVIKTLTDEQRSNLILLSKWGFDGKSGHSNYKQLGQNAVVIDDSSMFVTTYVPLQLYCHTETKPPCKLIVWQNPRPGSPRYARPLRFAFEKETVDSTVAEKDRVSAEINDLTATACNECSVKHTLLLTMLDGKAINAVTQTKSSRRCYICNVYQTNMNKLDVSRQQTVNKDALLKGFSVLHCWIRVMVCLFSIACRLIVKDGKVVGVAPKEDPERKKQLQEEFKRKMGLSIEIVKQGCGTTSDGNTARRFFQNYEQTCQITGLDKNVVCRLSTLLHALASCYEINAPAFQSYADVTADMYVKVYPWRDMTPTLHKLLCHGKDIIEALPLPVGFFTEEASEARNKDIVDYREFRTRKMSRLACNEDLAHQMLVTSDPLITSFRKLPQRKIGSFSREVFNLLKEPDLLETIIEEESESD